MGVFMPFGDGLSVSLALLFDNILEYDAAAGTAKFVRHESAFDFAAQRLTLEEASRIFAFDGGEDFSAVILGALGSAGKSGWMSFVSPGTGADTKYVGLFLSDGECCRFCFSRIDGDREAKQSSGVTVRTFGFFDVYNEGKPVLFHGNKTRELLAILVDRRGAYVSSAEAIRMMWPGRELDTALYTRYRKIAMRLSEVLRENGIEYIIEVVNGKRRIIPENIKCDYYDYLSDGDAAKNGFNGKYMENYLWSRDTLVTIQG